MFRHCRDRIRLHFVTFRRAQEKKLMATILARLDAIEAALKANAGSVSDVSDLKGEVEALSTKVDGAAPQTAVDAANARIDAIVAEIGTEEPVDPQPQPQS